MCGASPAGIGAKLCAEHATLQSLVKMVTSGRYRFPTVDCSEERRDEIKKAESKVREEVSRKSRKGVNYMEDLCLTLYSTGSKSGRSPVSSARTEGEQKES